MANNYYQKHKERFQKEAREKYQNLSEEEKDKRQKKSRKIYQNFKILKVLLLLDLNINLSKEQRQKLVEYRRDFYIYHNK